MCLEIFKITKEITFLKVLVTVSDKLISLYGWPYTLGIYIYFFQANILQT